MLSGARSVCAQAKGGKGVHCHGLSAVEVTGHDDVLQKLRDAQERRIVGETKMNKHSSRSHAVLQLRVSRRLRVLDASTGSMQVAKLSVTM